MRIIKHIFIYSLCFSFLITGYSQLPAYINYTVADGLPSNETFAIAQDLDGYIWIGTENGVSRFDGYNFTNFGIEHGLDHLEINQIHKDSRGKLWFGSLRGNLYYYEKGKFKPFPYNNILAQFESKFNLINFIGIENDVFYFSLSGGFDGGFLSVGMDGSYRKISPKEKIPCVFLLENKYCIYTPSYRPEILGKNKNLIVKKGTEEKKYFMQSQVSTAFSEAFFFKGDSLILIAGKYVNLIVDEKINSFIHKEKYTKVVVSENKIYGLGRQGTGLVIYDNVMDLINNKPNSKYFDFCEISNIFKDKDKGLWITTTNNGLYYIADETSFTYNHGELKGKKISDIFPLSSNKCLVSTKQGGFYEIDDRVRQLLNLNMPLESFQKKGGDIFVNSEHYDYKSRKMYNSKLMRAVKLFEKNCDGLDCIAANSKNIFRYNHKRKIYELLEYKKSRSPSKMNCILKKNDTKDRWIGTYNGLYSYNGDQFQKIVNNSPLINQRINDMVYIDNTRLLLGTKGVGLLVYNTATNIIEKNITVKDKLSSDFIYHISLGTEGILISTSQGLDILKIKNNNINIRNLNKNHGLSGRLFYKAVEKENTVWASSDEGLSSIKIKEIDSVTFKPIIESIELNGKKMESLAALQNMKLRGTINSLKVTFINFDYNLHNTVKYKYALNNEELKQMNGNVLEMIKLTPRKYDFKIIAYNKDNFPSKALELHFEIKVPWWKSKAFFMSLILILTAFIYTFFKMKSDSEIEKEKYVSLVTELEKQALLSQMNPHFIFNAIASIQYFINKNDIKEADDYLSRFSSLVRKTLDNSRKKIISLKEEIEILHLYVTIEQKRFNYNFTYSISIDEDIEEDFLHLPPMLIQPLVENAINHGFLHLKDRPGKLLIDIAIDDNKLLIIKVVDNGVGLRKNEISTHKSLALSIIDDRIDAYKRSGEYDIKFNLYNNEGGFGVTSEILIKSLKV